MWRVFASNPKAENADWSFLKGMASGNDVLSVEAKKRINQLLKKGGCKYELLEGYGMTEAGSCVSSHWTGVTPLDSIGIPLCTNIISIFSETDFDEELTYGKSGEICVSGPSVMAGYFNDPETTAKILKKHSDGRIWLHTGDLGHMDERGSIFFEGRLKRTIVTFKGFKLPPKQVEQIISKHPNIESCCVVGQPDLEHKAGQIPVAFLILKDPSKDTVAEVNELVEKSIPEDYYVKRYVVLERLPLTPNDKIDYRLLETLTE